MAINLPVLTSDYYRPGPFSEQPQLSEKVTRIDRQLTREAKTLIGQGDYCNAIDLLSRLIDADPTCAQHFNNRGYAYFQLGEVELAIADYDCAIALDPQLSEAYNNRGNAYVRQDDLYAALLDYDTAIDLNPFKLEAWINRGKSFRELKVYELALDNFDFALRLRQLQGYVYAERGRTYHKMGDWNWAMADYQQAIAYFEEAPQLSEMETRQYRNVLSWLDELLEPIR